MGYVQIRFPAGVQVESHRHALFGHFMLTGGPAAGDAPSSFVKVTGRATFGFPECFAGAGGVPRLLGEADR